MVADNRATGAGREFPLVGRQQELELLSAAAGTPPAVVFVEGEAGVGKSRLVQEAGTLLRRRGMRVLTAPCHPLREPLPFGPVLDALRGVGDWLADSRAMSGQAGALAPLLPELAGRLPETPPVPADARAARFQLVGAVRNVLEVLGPLVLIVEDLHWADEATRELLLLLARDLPKQLGLVLIYRREDLPSGSTVLGVPYRRPTGTNGAEIRVEALTEQEVKDMAAAALGHRASPALSRVLFERSGGLPLVVEEDLITLTVPGLQRPRPGRGTGVDSLGFGPDRVAAGDLAVLESSGTPRQLRETVTGRMTGLSPAAVAVVQAAAVLATPAGQDLLAAVAALDRPPAGDGLLEALQAAILAEAGPARYGFRHVLAQQAVYVDIPGPRREELHRRAVAVLRDLPTPPLVQIAHHTRALGDVEGWLAQAEEAADQAIALGDSGTATTLLHDILAQPRLDSDLRTRAALALARIATDCLDYATSAAALRRVLADPWLPDPTRGEIRLGLGRLMFNHYKDASGHREVKRAVQELADRPELAARAMSTLAIDDSTPRQQAAALMDAAERAAQDSPDQEARAFVRTSRLNLMANTADPELWKLVEQMPRHARDRGVRTQICRALNNVGYAARETGHDERAVVLLREGLDLAQELGHSVLVCYIRSNLLALDWLAGRWDGLEAGYAALQADFPELVPATKWALLIGGNLAAARGQWVPALEQLTRATRSEEKQLEVAPSCWAGRSIASVWLARDRPQEAWAACLPALDILRRAEAWPRSTGLVSTAVQSAVACGRGEDARALTAELDQGLRGLDAPAADAELHIASGLISQDAGDEAGAVQHYAQAANAYSAIGRPYPTARATEHAAAALAESAPDDAAGRYADAEAVYTRIGATADAARAQHALRELGHARPASRRRRTYGDQLSPRETQVAQLLAHGASNQDIAQALSLSPRTVEHHVARVLSKLHTTRDSVPAQPPTGL